eukprot:gene14976-21033_t
MSFTRDSSLVLHGPRSLRPKSACPVAHIRGGAFLLTSIPSLYGTGIGRTFEGKELESFVKEIENGLNLGREGKHAFVDADKPWECPEQVLHPWSLNGKSQQQVVLAVVVSHVSRVLHRAALRQTYDRQKTGNNFDLAFAVGHPTAGDVAQEEAQYIVEWILPTHRYQYLVKIDDDTYVNFPHFFSWMESKQVAFNNTPNVMFGTPLPRFFNLGAFYGFSTHLVKEIIPQVEPRFRGGKFEDQLAAAWSGKDDRTMRDKKAYVHKLELVHIT